MKINFLTEAEIKKEFPDAKVKNAFIQRLDLKVIGHFGNLVTIDMPISMGCSIANPLAGYNSTISCGVYIKILFELLGISEEDGVRISEIKDIPCRVIEIDYQIAAIGNFMEDKFIVFKSLPDKYEEFMTEISKNN